MYPRFLKKNYEMALKKETFTPYSKFFRLKFLRVKNVSIRFRKTNIDKMYPVVDRNGPIRKMLNACFFQSHFQILYRQNTFFAKSYTIRILFVIVLLDLLSITYQFRTTISFQSQTFLKI